jgi:hypothetical protein
MQNCRRERSHGRIKSGVVIYRNSCGQSRARGLSLLLVTFAENFPLVIGSANTAARRAMLRRSRLRARMHISSCRALLFLAELFVKTRSIRTALAPTEGLSAVYRDLSIGRRRKRRGRERDARNRFAEHRFPKESAADRPDDSAGRLSIYLASSSRFLSCREPLSYDESNDRDRSNRRSSISR